MESQSNSKHSSSHWLSDLSLTTSAVMWGINIPVVKNVTHTIDAFSFNAFRMIFAALALGMLAFFESRHQPTDWKKFPWRRALFFSLFSGLLYSATFMFGISKTTSANAAILMASMPMWTAILSMMFLKERLKGVTWFGLGVTFLGTAVVVASSGKLSLGWEYMLGNLIILVASIFWASATVISKPLMESIGPLQLAFFSSFITLPLHWLIAWPGLGEASKHVSEPNVLLSILYSGALSTGLAYATWNFGVKRLGGSHASVYQNVVTLVAVLVSWFVLKEQPIVTQWVGGALIIAGLFIMRRGR